MAYSVAVKSAPSFLRCRFPWLRFLKPLALARCWSISDEEMKLTKR